MDCCKKSVFCRLIIGLIFCVLMAGVQASPANKTSGHKTVGHKPESAHPFVISGVILNSDGARQIKAFARAFSEAADYPLQVHFVDSYSALSSVLRKDPLAIGWTCGSPFVEDHVNDGQQLISVPLFRGHPTYHSLVIARRGRTEKTLLDFKGQVLAYSDLRSNSSYVVPAYQLKKAGYEVQDYFRLLLLAGNHERSIEAVVNGLADVAAVDEYVWIEYLAAHPQVANKLQELERFGPFPFTPIVAGKAVSQGSLEHLQQALINLSQTAQGKKVLAALALDGFVKKDDDFYQPIEEMLHSLKQPLKSAP